MTDPIKGRPAARPAATRAPETIRGAGCNRRVDRDPNTPKSRAVAERSARLQPYHREFLEAAGLTSRTIAMAEAISVSAFEVFEARKLDFGPGIAFPYPGCRTPVGPPYRQILLDEARITSNGDVSRYLPLHRMLKTVGRPIYCPATLDPRLLADPGTLLIVAMSEIDTLAAIQANHAAVGLSGMTGFQKLDGTPIDGLADIEWKGRDVAVVLGSDAATDAKTLGGEIALRKEIRRRGAFPVVIRIPKPTDQEAETFKDQFGLAQFIASRGAEEFAVLVRVARQELPLGCRPASEILSEPVTPTRWLVEGLWPRRGCGFIAGDPKTLKSLLLIHLAVSVATGKAFLGFRVETGPVILVDEETDRDEFMARIRGTAVGLGLDSEKLPNLHIVAPGLMQLDDETAMEKLEELVAKVNPALVGLDPFAHLHTSDENDAGSMSRILSRLRRLQQRFGCAIVIVHHLSKKKDGGSATPGQRLRGSSALFGWLDSALYTEGHDPTIRVSFEARYSMRPKPLALRFAHDGKAARWELIANEKSAATPKASLDQDAEQVVHVLQEHPEGLSRPDLKKAAKLSEPRLAAALAALGDRVVIRKLMGPLGWPRKVFVLAGLRSET